MQLGGHSIFHPIPLLTLFLAVMGPASAQQQAPLTLATIHFTGLEHYSEKQSALASGLQVGSPVTLAQIQSASDRLAQSGAFDKISYRYSTHGTDVSVEFQVAETKNRLPCAFDNFVWFTPDELDRTLRARVPLYDGTVPERGNTSREIADALRVLLQTNGIAGTVNGFPSMKGDRYTSFAFGVSGVSMPVRSIHLSGAAGVPETDLVSAAKDLKDKDYSATDTEAVESLALLAIYYRHGYLQARFGPPQPAVIGNTRSGASFDIALTIPVIEGVQYSWDRASWTRNQKFSSDQLNGLLAMTPHEIANQDKIDAGLKAISTAYSKLGFIDATIAPGVSLDENARLVKYDSAVDEGIQYKMGELLITGLDDRTAGDLAKKWPIKPGQVFDGTCVRDFVKNTALPKIAASGKHFEHLDEHLERHKENATVDLALAFR